MNVPVGISPLAAVVLLLAGPAVAQPLGDAQASCAASIRAVLRDISLRDLDTSAGPPRNAFLTLNDAAIAEAERLDADVAAGRAKGPLHCMPVAVKDNFDTADMPVTVGSLALVGNAPPRDAALVAKLRQAGAIIVGKTNMDEFAMGIRGLSGAGGRVGNAYDPWQSAGGSSAGSGVAVGLGFVPLAAGSDNCGSLRIPAVYNGALSLRPTYGRFDAGGVFPIGFVNGAPGLIAKDTPTLRAGLRVIADDWRDAPAQAADALRGKKIGVVRHLERRDLWSAADAPTRTLFDGAIRTMQSAGATAVDFDLDRFDPRLGTEFIKGFGRRADAILARYPGPRRNWRDVCVSGRLMPEWSERECRANAASDARAERVAADRIAKNHRYVTGLMDRLQLDALLYPTDGRGGAQSEPSDDITCMIAGSSGLPAAAFPIGLDARGLPVGLELLGRSRDDEALVAMMGHFETLRGALPPPRRPAERPEVAALGIPQQNNLRLMLGWQAYRSRKGKDLGALRPDAFRALTDATVKSWSAERNR